MSRISRTSSWEIRSSSRMRPSRLYSPAHALSAARVTSSYSPVGDAGVAAERGQPSLEIRHELRGRLQQRIVPHEHRLVPHAEDPDELVDGIRMVVHAQVDVAVVAPLVPAAVADDQQRRGLPSALVPARRVAGHERGQQPVAQVALGLGERAGELGHDGLARQDVALRGEAVAGDAAGPRHALGAGERRRMPRRVDEPDLAVFPAVVGGQQPVQRGLRADAVRHQLQPFRAERRVRPRLRRDGPRARPGPRHDRADARELRGDRDPPVAGGHVGGHDRERHRSAHLRRTSWNAVW